jgi:hypothetical protein
MKEKAKNFIERMVNYAKTEKWEEVDKRIKEIRRYDVSEVVDIVQYLFQDEDGNIRDLAGTIVTELELKYLPQEKQQSVKELLRKGIRDEHPYAKFRATIAAIKHRLYEKEDVYIMKDTLKKIQEEELRELAAFYLKKLE